MFAHVKRHYYFLEKRKIHCREDWIHKILRQSISCWNFSMFLIQRSKISWIISSKMLWKSKVKIQAGLSIAFICWFWIWWKTPLSWIEKYVCSLHNWSMEIIHVIICQINIWIMLARILPIYFYHLNNI